MNSHRLQAALQSILSGAPERRHLLVLVTTCRQFAVAFLRRRRAGGRHSLSALSDDDLALDCIADLFERDEWGRFSRIRGYFEANDWESVDEEMLVTLLRRLVFRKVKDGIYRVAQENDPSLARLIRSLRTAAEGQSEMQLVRDGATSWMCVDGALPGNSAVVMPAEVLQRRMHVCDQPPSGPALLACAIRVLRHQSAYAKIYPLVGMALLLRANLARMMDESVSSGDPMSSLEASELRHMADEASTLVANRLRNRYVPDKLDESRFSLYFSAATDVLVGELENEAPVHREALQRVAGPLSQEAYRSEHRYFLEYFLKLVRTEFQEMAKKEFGFSAT